MATRRELTVEDIHLRGHGELRTVRRRVGKWFARQHVDATVPRVRRARRPWDDRWVYLVDAESYERFTAARQAMPVFDSDEARNAGCSCLASTLPGGQRGAIVSEACPVHRPLFEKA